MSRDLHNTINIFHALNPQVVTGTDTAATAVDSQGYDSVEHVVPIGTSGDTLSASVKLELVIQHGDLSDGSDAVAVTDKNMLLSPSADLTSGIFQLIDANSKTQLTYKIGYRGPKRYSRVFFDFTGTHTNGTRIAALALRGDAHIEKVA